jgi:hypothetical protein
MKKVLAVLALALFLGGIAVPAIAAVNSEAAQIVLAEDEPKKDEKKKAEKSDKKAKKSEKSSECTTSEKKSDCSKTCDKSS